MPDQINTNPKWTIMVYIAADDTLADFAVGSLQQLRSVAIQYPNVAVVAQFDANGKQNIPRLIFDSTGDQNGSIHKSKRGSVPYDSNMADPFVLSDFITWACTQRPADYYCLVLWGHGPELLVEDYTGLPGAKKAKRFLTPSDVKQALADSKLKRDGPKFEILAMDACNMCMVELACEIQDYADFLVASQEEVPDFSFPYDKLLTFAKAKSRSDIAQACREMPLRYIRAYDDYTETNATPTASITLSSLSLKDGKGRKGMIDLLSRLTGALLQAGRDDKKRQAIIEARASTKEFVLGLYVDLYDFCERLISKFGLLQMTDQDLQSACKQIREAIDARDADAFVIANEVSQDERCHGLSIYFPYRTCLTKEPTRTITMERTQTGAQKGNGTESLERGAPEVSNRGEMNLQGKPAMEALNQLRGGTGGVGIQKNVEGVVLEGGRDALDKGLSKGGRDALDKMRMQRIEETEQYYASLEFSIKTHWDEFIRHGWSRWLAEDAAAKVESSLQMDMSQLLNGQYSAQQCAFNLLSLCRELESRLEKCEKASVTQAK
jgi:hypothetical protein